jgi:aquaporin TIP
MSRFELTPESLGLTAADLGVKAWRAALAELIAVLLFVFVGAGSVVAIVNVMGRVPAEDAGALVGIALAHGLAIAVMVAATARISGGHINPAVTFSMVLTGRMKFGPGVVYVAAQLVGAVMGALLLKVVLVDSVEGNLGAHGLSPALSSDGAGALVEVVLTFVLVFVVFATAVDKRGLGNAAPIAIGLAILIDHFVGVPLTGASMNPARSFGPALVAGEWDDHWVFWVGPLAGGALAGLVYYFIYLNRPDED